ncbi:hypothetical protein A9Q96_05185 [Rhodobacterales bacterium 52_120_T64]|nr:hypothetical protein A9Q96_05185 [Rhodobacterales bacterium 52_120_T64]
MASIRLEKFAYMHHSDPGTKLVSGDEIEAIRKEAFEAGIRDGAAAASDAFSTEQSRCLSSIREVIGDAFFSREEAHRMALSSLRPLIESLAEAIAPTLSNAGLSAEIAKIAQGAAIRAPDDTLTVFVPTGLGTDIAEMLEHTIPSVSISEDPILQSAQARISWSGGFDLIDLNATSAAAIDAIGGFFTELEQLPEMEIQHAN